jgi:hypothetical protein
MLGWRSLVLNLLACRPGGPGVAPGEILGITAAGERAAVEWFDGTTAGAVQLAAVGRTGRAEWIRPVHGGAVPPDPQVDTAGAPWVLRAGAGGELRGIDPASGNATWRCAAPPDAAWSGDAEVVTMWSPRELVVLDRRSGRERWRASLVEASRRAVRSIGSRIAVGDDARITVFGAEGERELDVATYPGAFAVGVRAAAWTDPAHASWFTVYGQPPVRLPLEGRIRPGGGERDGTLILPLHLPSGDARLVAVGVAGEILWTTDLGAGSVVPLEGGADWPAHVPFVFEHADGSRRVVLLDVASGRTEIGAPVPAPRLHDVHRLVRDHAIFLVERLAILQAGADGPSAFTLPEPERARPAGRIGADGSWSEVNRRVVFSAWDATSGRSSIALRSWGL